jgi:hypothetical protein
VVIFIGIGLSGLMHLEFSLMALVAYFLITINVSINAHLKKEFKLTYAGLGPTEFRLIMIIINTIYIYSTTLRNFSVAVEVFGREISLKSLDILGISVTIILFIMYFYEIFNDAKEYAVIDPLKKK